MKPFTRLAIVVLWLIALPQLLLFIAKREITLNGAPVPLWLSVLVAALAASLAVMVWRERPQYKSKPPSGRYGPPSGSAARLQVDSGSSSNSITKPQSTGLRAGHRREGKPADLDRAC